MWLAGSPALVSRAFRPCARGCGSVCCDCASRACGHVARGCTRPEAWLRTPSKRDCCDERFTLPNNQSASQLGGAWAARELGSHPRTPGSYPLREAGGTPGLGSVTSLARGGARLKWRIISQGKGSPGRLARLIVTSALTWLEHTRQWDINRIEHHHYRHPTSPA